MEGLLPLMAARFSYLLLLVGRCRLALLLLLSLLFVPSLSAAKTNYAELKISGYGFIKDWELKQSLKTIQGNQLKQELLNANLLEDCAVILLARLRKDGFLHPAIELKMTLPDGQKSNVLWRDTIEPPLTPDLKVRAVHFKLEPGTRYYYRKIYFQGLTTLPRSQALTYFYETGVIPFHSGRVFSPDNLRRGVSSLTEVLQRQGYANADAAISRQQINDRNGAVDVWINVDQGPRFIVRSIRVDTYLGSTNAVGTPNQTQVIETNTPYSRYWVEDFSTGLKATNYHQGYPDTAVTLQPSSSNTAPGLIFLHLLANVVTGPEIFVHDIKFNGQKRTKEFVLKRRMSLQPGDRLDPLKAEHGRNRLARLGVFESVELRYAAVTPESRDVIYNLREAKALTVNLLLGWGSYEMLRGGAEVQRNNVFGWGHTARLRAIQSFKASQGDFTYTIPDWFGENVDLFSRGFALRREEINFTREEYGGGAGVHRHFASISTDLTGRYEYQILNAVSLGGEFEAVGPLNPGVGAIIIDMQHDRRDNPLYPRRGYKIFSTVEFASPYFVSDVTYQRFNLAASVHHQIISGLGMNIGFSHGFITTPDSSETDIPFNKRFFPGGADSIRGYQEGEAAPRNVDGKLIGAESYMLGNFELEQSLTRLFSVVGFVDAVGITPNFNHYPFEQTLYSAGGGLRAKTIVGPVRLEYGYNLNPRPHDPSGTIQFSFGFPF